jgi:hypothetical protein
VPERIHPVVLGLGFVAGMTAAWVWAPGPVFLLLVVGYVVTSFVPMPTPSGLGVSMAPALAGAVALASHGSAVLVLGAGAVALPLSRLAVWLRHRRFVDDGRLPSEPAGIAVFGASFAGAVLLVDGYAVDDPIVLGLYAAAAFAGYLASAVVRAAIPDRIAPRRLQLIRALADWPAHAILYSAAALYAVTAPVMGWWALPLAGLPYAFGHISLHRLRVTRLTYQQTMRALGRIPEAGGMNAAGHAERTAALAAAVGAQLGMGRQSLDRIEYAALLHDIGRLVLANPAVAGGTYTPSDVTAWSAAIIGEAAHLEPVASLVAVLHAPYRRPGEERDPALSREAHVVRVVSAYDEEIAGGGTPLQAIETLHRGAAYDFDPEVVAVLRKVLERRGEIAA